MSHWLDDGDDLMLHGGFDYLYEARLFVRTIRTNALSITVIHFLVTIVVGKT